MDGRFSIKKKTNTLIYPTQRKLKGSFSERLNERCLTFNPKLYTKESKGHSCPKTTELIKIIVLCKLTFSLFKKFDSPIVSFPLFLILENIQ